MFTKQGDKTYTWLAILLAFGACAIAISGKGLSTNLLKSNRITEYMGRLSFAVFLIHMPVISLFSAYYKNIDIMYSHKIEFIVLVFCLSVIFDLTMKHIIKLFRLMAASMRRYIVN